MAKAVTNKLMSKLPSWLGGSQQPASTSNDQKIQNENVSEFMYPKFELIDYQRVGNNIWLSPPNYQLAVIADNLGRIVMIDLNKGIMIRMWKGYRDAQCGFVEVIESKSKKGEKKIIFNKKIKLQSFLGSFQSKELNIVEAACF